MNLSHYILLFFGSIACFLPYRTKAAAPFNGNIPRSPTTINTTWHPYPCSIQLRSRWMVHKHIDRFTNDTTEPLSNEKLLVAMLTTIDVDILYVHSFFARQLASYPRIGLSFLLPYALQKEPKLRFPNIWGILAYIELYQSDPALSTWGHRISMGAIKNGILVRAQHPPNYSFLATTEIIYHQLYTPSWQLNYGMGLLINGWIKNRQDSLKLNQVSRTDQPNTTKKTFNNVDNDAIRLKFAPLFTIGIRYITHTEPFLRPGAHPIHYRKQKRSRVDCSITGNSRWRASTQTHYLIFRGSSLLSFAINTHNALLFAMEVGYNGYKKALLAKMLPTGGIEVTTLLGYEIGYGRYLLQLQLGFEITDSKKPTIRNVNEGILSILNKKSNLSVHLQYMLTEHFFVGISARSQEIPGLRLGVSL